MLVISVATACCNGAAVSIYCRAEARYPSGKGEVCKTFIRGFDSHPRLHQIPQRNKRLRHCLFLVYPPCTLESQFPARADRFSTLSASLLRVVPAEISPTD